MQKQKSPGMGEHRAVKRILPPAVALAISLLGVEAKELHGMPAEVRQQLPSIKTEITEPGRQDRQGEIRRVVRVRPTRARRRINAPLPYTRMHSRRGARIRRQMLQQRASSRLLEEKRLSPDDAPTLAALSNHHDPEIRLQAVQSLQKIGPQSFTHLTKFLSDPDKEVAYAAWEAAAAVAPQQKHLMQGISAKSRPETISLAGTAAGFLGETGNTEFIDPILSTVERLSRVMEMGKHPEETGRALISCARAVGSLDQSPATFNRLKDASERIQGRRPFYTDFLGSFWEAEASASMLEPSIKGIDTTAPERGKSSLLGEFERRRSSLKSDDIDGHYDLGLWCVGNNLLDEGIGMLEETIKLQPSNSFAHFQLGKAYAAVGNYCEARRRLGHAVRNMSNPVKKKPPELVEKLREWDELYGMDWRDWNPAIAENAVDVAREIMGIAKHPIVLVDRSKWAYSWKVLNPSPKEKAEVGHRFRMNFDRIDRENLRHFDVFAIMTDGRVFLNEHGRRVNITYDSAEVNELKTFVSNGGGLILAGDGGFWMHHNLKVARDAGIPPLHLFDMPLNRIARAFGIVFTDKRVSESALRRTRFYSHSCFGDHSPDEAGTFLKCSYSRVDYSSPKARVLMRAGDGSPIAVAMEYGRGRVIAIGGLRLPREKKACELASQLCEWLAGDKPSIDGGHLHHNLLNIESRNFIQLDNFRVGFDPQISYRVPYLLNLIRSAAGVVEDYFGVELPEMNARLMPAFSGGLAGTQISVGALGEYDKVVGVTAHELTHTVYRGVLGEELARFIGIKSRWINGFTAEADREFRKDMEAFRKADPTGNRIDISREAGPGKHGKGVWVFKTLEDRYGGDILKKFMNELERDGRTTWKLGLDDFVYYMSLAAGEDLYPWFQQIGTTVHPRQIEFNR